VLAVLPGTSEVPNINKHAGPPPQDIEQSRVLQYSLEAEPPPKPRDPPVIPHKVLLFA
jgi:hypothetical protein